MILHKILFDNTIIQKIQDFYMTYIIKQLCVIILLQLHVQY